MRTRTRTYARLALCAAIEAGTHRECDGKPHLRTHTHASRTLARFFFYLCGILIPTARYGRDNH